MAETLHFELVTPEKLAMSAPVGMVEIPGEMGDFGVLPGHAPFMSMIRPGVVKVHGDSPKRLFVSGGYAEVNPQGCIVLAEHVRDLAEVDKVTAEAELKDAQHDYDHAEEVAKPRAEKRLLLAHVLVEALSADLA